MEWKFSWVKKCKVKLKLKVVFDDNSIMICHFFTGILTMAFH